MKSRILSTLLLSGALVACGNRGVVTLGNGQSGNTVTLDFAIAYVKRAVPTTTDDLTDQRDISTKADLYIRDQASAGAAEHNITGNSACPTGTGNWDIKDLDVSPDGTKLIFAMRGPLVDNQKERETPFWNLYTYTIGGTDPCPEPVISDTTVAQSGQDVSPHFLPNNLPDSRILFSSTRQPQSKTLLLDEGKPLFDAQTENIDQPAFTLHIMNSDGTDLHQVSFNQSHDTYATVLSTGRVVFTRWSHAAGTDGARRDGFDLYSANPDGSDVQLLYGAESHDTGSNGSTIEFVKVHEMQNGKLLTLVRPRTNADFGGNLYIIDTNCFVENRQTVLLPTANCTSNVTPPAQIPATTNDVRTGTATDAAGDDQPETSPGGRFTAAYPLWDDTNRILVSWTQCRLQDAQGTILACTADNLANTALLHAPPLYSVWLFNPNDNTLKPVMQPVEGVMVSEVVALQARTAPSYIADTPTSVELGSTLAILDIKSVYDWDGAPAPVLTGNAAANTIAAVSVAPAVNRPARFLRIEKAVSLPSRRTDDGNGYDFDRTIAFGPNGGFMREIVGYVPIEPDGSVRTLVPADAALMFSVLDANGQRLFQPGNTWVTLRGGEAGQPTVQADQSLLYDGKGYSCYGCYFRSQTVSNVVLSHTRAGLFPVLYSGADSFGGGAAVQPLAGCTETMAEALTGWNCGDKPYAASTPSMNVVFVDPWFGGGTGNETVAYVYSSNALASGLTTPLPTSSTCAQTWNYTCRSIINYESIISPLWSVTRGTVSATFPLGSDTCVGCHTRTVTPARQQTVSCTPTGTTTPVDVVVNEGPAGGLELDANAPQTTAGRFGSYDQLLEGAQNAPTFNAATDIDPTTCTQLNDTTGSAPVSLHAGSALGSKASFFAKFATGGTHAGRLTAAELRLLSEWVDIGAQYYNNPFSAPLAN
ncbi:MAG TPA: hypothetical protein VMI92_07135 [Steroidobacteraceae bacterium]|nr:hypothetical protein [Steroidobacteraceae bacterium]